MKATVNQEQFFQMIKIKHVYACSGKSSRNGVGMRCACVCKPFAHHHFMQFYLDYKRYEEYSIVQITSTHTCISQFYANSRRFAGRGLITILKILFEKAGCAICIAEDDADQ